MTKQQTEELRATAKWITEHETTLKSLYKTFQKETKDKTTPFVAFGFHMYKKTKH